MAPPGASSTRASGAQPSDARRPASIPATAPPCECPARAILPTNGRVRAYSYTALASSISDGTVQVSTSPSLFPCPLKSNLSTAYPALTNLPAILGMGMIFLCDITPCISMTKSHRSESGSKPRGNWSTADSLPFGPWIKPGPALPTGYDCPAAAEITEPSSPDRTIANPRFISRRDYFWRQ